MDHVLESANAPDATRQALITLLNSGLTREFQAIISYVFDSHVFNITRDIKIAAELKTHVAEELAHALSVAGQIGHLEDDQSR